MASILTPRAAAAARNLQAARSLVLATHFHTARVNRAQPSPTSKAEAYPYVPGGPVLQGTVNDATTYPPPSKSHGSYHWAFERLLSAALVPLTAASFVMSTSQHPVVDGLLAISLIVHSHIGFDSVVVDYLHPRKFPVLGRVVTWALRAATTAALVGVYQFNTNDVGLTELIRRVWHA